MRNRSAAEPIVISFITVPILPERDPGQHESKAGHVNRHAEAAARDASETVVVHLSGGRPNPGRSRARCRFPKPVIRLSEFTGRFEGLGTPLRTT